MSGENRERSEGSGGGFAHPHRIMIGLYLGAFVGMFGETAMNIAMSQLSEAFAAPVSMM